jgi:hypothetical protein
MSTGHSGVSVSRQVSMRIVLSRILWLEGAADQARDLAAEAVDIAASDNPNALCDALGHAACPIAFWRGDLEAAMGYTQTLLEYARRYTLSRWYIAGLCFRQLEPTQSDPGEDPTPLPGLQRDLLATMTHRWVDATTCLEVDLGVNLGRLGTPVAQQFADLREGGTLAQHLRGQSMTKLMGTGGGCLDPGTQECTTNDCSYGALTQKSAKRSSGAQKHPTAAATGSSVPKISHDRIPHILRQRKLRAPTTLAMDAEASVLPVDVVELQRGHLSGTQPQASEQQQDRVVAPSHRSAAIDPAEQSAYLLGCDASGNRGPRPVGHTRDDRGQIQSHLSAVT